MVSLRPATRTTRPSYLRGRIRHVPGNHDVRWDPTAKELYRAHFGTAPYSFDAGGVHVTAFGPTQPLLEPGHCGTAALDWLAALLELMARHDVRGLIAGHVHRETVARLDGLTR